MRVTVDVREDPAKDRWHVSYLFSRPVAGAAWRRNRHRFRVAGWSNPTQGTTRWAENRGREALVTRDFAKPIRSFQVELPPLTQLIILFSNLFVHHLPALVFTTIGIYLAWGAYVSTEVGQVTKWNMIFKIPFMGQFVMNIMVERLLTTMSALIESGVSILNTITVLEGVFATNIIFQRFLKRVKVDVGSGKSISVAFKRTGILPPLVTEMMFMGEESGKLPDMLVTLSGFYREQIDQFTRRFTAIIEPIMVVGIGAVVGTIVLAVFMPIFKMSTIGAK